MTHTVNMAKGYGLEWSLPSVLAKMLLQQVDLRGSQSGISLKERYVD